MAKSANPTPEELWDDNCTPLMREYRVTGGFINPDLRTDDDEWFLDWVTAVAHDRRTGSILSRHAWFKMFLEEQGDNFPLPQNIEVLDVRETISSGPGAEIKATASSPQQDDEPVPQPQAQASNGVRKPNDTYYWVRNSWLARLFRRPEYVRKSFGDIRVRQIYWNDAGTQFRKTGFTEAELITIPTQQTVNETVEDTNLADNRSDERGNNGVSNGVLALFAILAVLLILVGFGWNWRYDQLNDSTQGAISELASDVASLRTNDQQAIDDLQNQLNELKTTVDANNSVASAQLMAIQHQLEILSGQGSGNGVPPSTNPTDPSATPGAAGTATCPTQAEASQMIAGNDTALVKEPSEVCLFEWRAPLAIDSQTWCPDPGFINPRSNVMSPWKWDCELDPSPTDPHGNQGIVFQGGNEMVMIDAGSFRVIDAYPAGDPVYDACASLANHRMNLITNPPADLNFWQWPGNFVCDESQQPQQPVHSNMCPDTAADVVSALGGSSANEWHRLNDGQWKRVSTVKANLTAAFGTLDWWDGHNAHMGTHEAQGALDATWNCLAQ